MQQDGKSQNLEYVVALLRSSYSDSPMLWIVHETNLYIAEFLRYASLTVAG